MSQLWIYPRAGKLDLGTIVEVSNPHDSQEPAKLPTLHQHVIVKFDSGAPHETGTVLQSDSALLVVGFGARRITFTRDLETITSSQIFDFVYKVTLLD